MQSWDDEQLARLRPMYEGLFDLWTVPVYQPRHTVWCARRVGTDTACINTDSPEQLVRLLGEMACQCPRHHHHG